MGKQVGDDLNYDISQLAINQFIYESGERIYRKYKRGLIKLKKWLALRILKKGARRISFISQTIAPLKLFLVYG